VRGGSVSTGSLDRRYFVLSICYGLGAVGLSNVTGYGAILALVSIIIATSRERIDLSNLFDAIRSDDVTIWTKTLNFVTDAMFGLLLVMSGRALPDFFGFKLSQSLEWTLVGVFVAGFIVWTIYGGWRDIGERWGYSSDGFVKGAKVDRMKYHG
jgi:hypothetical protein